MSAARRFAGSLRTAGHEPGQLLIVGTPEQEPWHLTAHLADAARWRDVPALQPALVRWHVPAGAPPHLSLGIDAVPAARRGTTLLVAAPGDVGEGLLERLADARRGGANVFALHDGVDELDALVHESLSTPGAITPGAAFGFDVASHVLTDVALDAPGRPRHALWTSFSSPVRLRPHRSKIDVGKDTPNG